MYLFLNLPMCSVGFPKSIMNLVSLILLKSFLLPCASYFLIKDICVGVIKVGYYPEVIQHTNWDYGRNGKGYYNDMFAPGWTVASLWELLTPGRTENILLK